MANRAVVQSEAVWKGEIVIGGVKARGEFEVLQSGGGWKFLFGKLLLQVFKAVHYYKVNEVRVSGTGGTTTLYNQVPNNSTTVLKEPGIQTVEKREAITGEMGSPVR